MKNYQLGMGVVFAKEDIELKEQSTNETDAEDALAFIDSQVVVLAFQHKVGDVTKFIYSFRKLSSLEDPILTERTLCSTGVRLNLFYLKRIMNDDEEMLVFVYDNKRPLFWEIKSSEEEMKLVKLD